MLRTAITLLSLLSCGCSTLVLKIGDPIDVGVCSSFESGHTTRAEVLAALGPPAALARHDGGVALLYEFVVMDEDQLGIGLDVLQGIFSGGIIDLFKFSTGDSNVQRDAIVLMFDREGVLAGYAPTGWVEDYGEGSGLQFFIAVQSVVDSKSLRQPPRALTWGDEMFRVPPVALNLANLPDLELIGSPVGANR